MEDKIYQCPECEGEQFFTEPYHYDILEFDGENFVIVNEEYGDEYKIYCRDCGEEVDEDLSIKKKRIILKTNG